MKYKLFASLLLIPLLGGCLPGPRPPATPGGGAQHVPTETPGSRIAYTIAQTVPGTFADYVPIPVDVIPAVPAYSTNLDGVDNPQAIHHLSDAQRDLLEQNGFVVVPTEIWQIYTIYQSAEKNGEPVLVTTDAMLHTFHILYDYCLRFAEIEHFVDDLQGLNATMIEAAQAQYAGASGDVHEAARRNLAFFTVASALLDPGTEIPAVVADDVSAELSLIEAHSGFAPSPIFGYKEDYSQYVPRGHYTRNETFERYFKAMMWYGRMAFRLKPGDNPEALEMGRMETRQAILIVSALLNAQVDGEPGLDVWERIYEPTVFFVGKTDDLNVYDYAQIIRTVYGEELALDALADNDKLDAFIEQAMTLRPPKIVGGYVTDQEDPQVVTKSFRFMGQRFIPDSYIFQQLVYDKVKLYQGDDRPFTLVDSQAGPIRGFPRGLDVPAVFGSARAEAILHSEGDTEYDGYDAQLAKLRAEFAALPDEQWTENLYWSWLYSLRPLLEVKGEGYPVFMQNQAWADKDLNGFLGSWTELRHDTILYAKQSYTMRATSVPVRPKLVEGYVEPVPEFYARMLAMTKMTLKGLDDMKVLDDKAKRRLGALENILQQLLDISVKELAGKQLTKKEYAFIRNFGRNLDAIITGVASRGKETTMIADVHTDQNTKKCLEEGVGYVKMIVVAYRMPDGGIIMGAGPVMSYYEFKHPMEDRLTDEKWKAILKAGKAPAQPKWTGSFSNET